jgi:hypothetical protein
MCSPSSQLTGEDFHVTQPLANNALGVVKRLGLKTLGHIPQYRLNTQETVWLIFNAVEFSSVQIPVQMEWGGYREQSSRSRRVRYKGRGKVTEGAGIGSVNWEEKMEMQVEVMLRVKVKLWLANKKGGRNKVVGTNSRTRDRLRVQDFNDMGISNLKVISRYPRFAPANSVH